MLRVSDTATFDGLSDDLITKVSSFAKSDTAAKIFDAAKGFLSKKGAAVPAVPIQNPYTIAPTSINWTGVVLPIAGGVLGLGILAWAILRK